MNKTFSKTMMSKTFRDVDWLLVTVDVTDRGDLDSWHYFWEVIEQAGFKNRCLVAPGNYDACNLGLSRISKRESPEEGHTRLQRLCRGLTLGRQSVTFPWVRKISDSIAIFGLDSSNHGNMSILSNAVGNLGFRQLEALARLLKTYRDVPVKIIMLHHSPNISEKDTERKRGLPPTSKLARLGHEVPEGHRRALRLLAVTQNAQLIIHGHLHREETRRVNGVRIIGVPATTEVIGVKTAPVRVYDIYTNSKKIFSRLQE